MTEPIIDFLRRELRQAGADAWPAIVQATGVNYHQIRKIAYGDRDNPTLRTVQPLLDYFAAVDVPVKAGSAHCAG